MSTVQPPDASTDPAAPLAPATPPAAAWRALALGPAEQAALVERLVAHRTVGPAPREELAWLVAHGKLRVFEPGVVIASPIQPVEGMYILLTGRISIHVVRAGTRHKVAEWTAGDVTGLLPYSRLTTPPGDTVIQEPTEFLLLPREHLEAMARECHEVTSILVHVMLDRARFFTTTFLHDEKLRSIGKLAAGLAHELNNPAAAITRFAKMLPGVLDGVEASAQALGRAGLTDAEAEALQRVGAVCQVALPQHVRSTLQEAEREEAFATWLESRGVDSSRAEALSQSPLTLEALDELAASVRAEVLGTAVDWMAMDTTVRGLAREIEQAATRVSDLVTAVRGFTRVDEMPVPQSVNIADGLAQTLAVLKGKARGKGLAITVDVAPGMPPVRGVGAELNQVWANLIDNAIDAAPESGSVSVTVRQDGSQVEVRVVDNGPGIPEEIRSRIFDPFFTTKDVGKGTGLGLDIARRLVERHDGDIDVHSKPGRTEFVVSLPASPVDGARAAEPAANRAQQSDGR
jgi:signal transduction histidine kinase